MIESRFSRLLGNEINALSPICPLQLIPLPGMGQVPAKVETQKLHHSALSLDPQASCTMRAALFGLPGFWLGLGVGLLLLLLAGDSGLVSAKRYLRCELARKLLEPPYRFDRSLLSNWICLLEHESELDTSRITSNPNGSRNYGLFQINSRFCQEGRRGGICNVKCEDLLEENLMEASACAKRIHTSDGFQHWNGWQRYCRNTQNLPNLKVICGI